MRLGRHRVWWLACQFQRECIGSRCFREFVVRELQVAGGNGGGERVDGVGRRRAVRQRLCERLTSLDPVTCELMSVPQRPGCSRAEGNVGRVEVLEGAPRLSEDRRDVVVYDCQRGPHGGDAPQQVAVLAVVAACRRRLGRRQLLLYSGSVATEQGSGSVRDPQRWSSIQDGWRKRSEERRVG